MKITDVWSYYNLMDLINKVAEENSSPLTIIKGLLLFDPLGNPEIEFNASIIKNGKWFKIKRLRRIFGSILEYSVDDCLYILRKMVERLRLEPLRNIKKKIKG